MQGCSHGGCSVPIVERGPKTRLGLLRVPVRWLDSHSQRLLVFCLLVPARVLLLHSCQLLVPARVILHDHQLVPARVLLLQCRWSVPSEILIHLCLVVDIMVVAVEVVSVNVEDVVATGLVTMTWRKHQNLKR